MKTRGIVEMKGESGPGVGVDVFVDQYRIRLVSGDELIGDWDRDLVGIKALDDGFAIRAEGEELVLKTEEDVAVAEELGLMAASPRMARRVAASHPPEERAPTEEKEAPPSNLGPLVFALGGVLIVAGGFLLRTPDVETGSDYWFAFLISGLAMAAIAFFMSVNRRLTRIAAVIVLLIVVLLFGLAAEDTRLDADQLLAFGFIAGGIVIGVAVLVSGGFGEGDEAGR